jgi:hypothetical protein
MVSALDALIVRGEGIVDRLVPSENRGEKNALAAW